MQSYFLHLERIKIIYINFNGKNCFGFRTNHFSNSLLERIMFNKRGLTVQYFNLPSSFLMLALHDKRKSFPETESSRTPLASRTQFEVLGFGLKACKSSKMPWPQLEDSTIFWLIESGPRSWPILFCLEELRELAKKTLKTFLLLENSWIFRKIYELLKRTPFFFRERLNIPESWRIFGAKTLFFGDQIGIVSLVLDLGLEHFCPWPREGLSSEGLPLASDFFVFLASSLVYSTPPLELFTELIIRRGRQPARQHKLTEV